MNLEDLFFECKEEWPEATIEYPNTKDAMLLQEDYAAKNSETTAIFTYIQQSYLLAEVDQTLSKILEKIAIVEMEHHEELGVMIVKLGGDPVIGARGGWWNGSYVNYVKNIRDMLINNIKIEKIAINNYKKTISQLSNESIKEVIRRIIKDEEAHIKTFNALLDYIIFWK